MSSLWFLTKTTMTLREALAVTIKALRKSKNLSQEDFSVVSSRTYLSSLERGLKSPTLDKLEQIADVLGVQPASIVVLAYAIKNGNNDIASAIEAIIHEAKSAMSSIDVG